VSNQQVKQTVPLNKPVAALYYGCMPGGCSGDTDARLGILTPWLVTLRAALYPCAAMPMALRESGCAWTQHRGTAGHGKWLHTLTCTRRILISLPDAQLRICIHLANMLPAVPKQSKCLITDASPLNPSQATQVREQIVCNMLKEIKLNFTKIYFIYPCSSQSLQCMYI
jgi:hypothetical protein